MSATLRRQARAMAVATWPPRAHGSAGSVGGLGGRRTPGSCRPVGETRWRGGCGPGLVRSRCARGRDPRPAPVSPHRGPGSRPGAQRVLGPRAPRALRARSQSASASPPVVRRRRPGSGDGTGRCRRANRRGPGGPGPNTPPWWPPSERWLAPPGRLRLTVVRGRRRCRPRPPRLAHVQQSAPPL